MAKKKIMGVDTKTLLLLGGGAALLYFISKRSSPAPPPVIYRAPFPAAGNTAAGEIAAGGTAVSSILTSLANAGVFGESTTS